MYVKLTNVRHFAYYFLFISRFNSLDICKKKTSNSKSIHFDTILTIYKISYIFIFIFFLNVCASSYLTDVLKMCSTKGLSFNSLDTYFNNIYIESNLSFIFLFYILFYSWKIVCPNLHILWLYQIFMCIISYYGFVMSEVYIVGWAV